MNCYDNIKIKPNEINSDLDKTILYKLQDKIGNKCNKYGFINSESIIIKNKSKPKIISQHFDGSLYYKIEYTAEIINPSLNSKIKCKILKKNKHGILANINCIYVVIPYIYNNINNENQFKNLNIGDEINIIVIEKNYEINDKQINVLGKII